MSKQTKNVAVNQMINNHSIKEKQKSLFKLKNQKFRMQSPKLHLRKT